MTPLEFNDYRDFLKQKLKTRPYSERGGLAALASRLRIHPSLLPQVLQGSRDLSSEQAEALGHEFGLSDDEKDYFLTQVDHARAGTQNLKQSLQKRLDRIRTSIESTPAGNSNDAKLTEAQRAIFYSNWYFSAARQLTSINPPVSAESIASQLKLPNRLIHQVMEFLVSAGLCRRDKNGFSVGPAQTWIDSESPLVIRHHHNWRMRSMERMPTKDKEDLFLTMPMTLAEKDIAEVRKLLDALDKKVNRIVRDSPSEKFFCLNLDWFEVK